MEHTNSVLLFEERSVAGEIAKYFRDYVGWDKVKVVKLDAGDYAVKVGEKFLLADGL